MWNIIPAFEGIRVKAAAKPLRNLLDKREKNNYSHALDKYSYRAHQRIKKQQNGPPSHVEFLQKKLQKTAPETSGKEIRMTTKNTANNTARRGAEPTRSRGLTLAWSGVDSRQIRRFRRLAAALFVLGAAVAAPEARAAVLVSNFGQVTDDTGRIFSIAQSFRTGAHAADYTLTSILLDCGDCNNYTIGTVTLHNGTRTGTKVADFTITSPHNLLATPTSSTTLSADTTYVIVTTSDFPISFSWYAAADNALDGTSAAGWTIPAGYEFYKTSTSMWETATGSKQFRVNGDPITANTAPTVANQIPNQAATAGTAFSYAFLANTFNDAESDALTYTATKPDGAVLPTWLGFNAGTRTFSGTPQAADVATVAVKVTASDGNGGSASDEFNIVVSADTTAPTLTSAVVNQGGVFVQLQFSEDVEQSNLPPDTAVTVTAGGNALTITDVRVAPGQLDRYRVLVSPGIRQGQAVILTYTDPSGGNDANAFQDTAGNDAASFTTGSGGVTAVVNGSTLTNNAPTVANQIPNQTATAGTAFSYAFLANTFNDANGDTLSYTATKSDGPMLPTWLGFNASTRTFAGTPAASDVGTVSVKVTANDSNGGLVSDEFNIVVSAMADTPPPTPAKVLKGAISAAAADGDSDPGEPE